MIVPNLLVRSLLKSVEFYRDGLGFDVMMVLTADDQMIEDPADPTAVFATLALGDHQLMLQTQAHLEAAGVSPPLRIDPAFTGSLYLRDFPFEERFAHLPGGSVIRAPSKAWYGMLELVIEDPDGYRIVLGHREGAPPV